MYSLHRNLIILCLLLLAISVAWPALAAPHLWSY